MDPKHPEINKRLKRRPLVAWCVCVFGFSPVDFKLNARNRSKTQQQQQQQKPTCVSVPTEENEGRF